MTGITGFNIRARLVLVCVLFGLPLILSLALYGTRVHRDFQFNARELSGVQGLKSAWRSAGPAGRDESVRRIRSIAAEALILDDDPETYRLAHALTSSLTELAAARAQTNDAVNLAMTARLAADAAADLSDAAATDGDAGQRARLRARAQELRGLATTPRAYSKAEADRWWTATLADVQNLLEARRARMIRQLASQILLIAGFAAAATILSFRIARGFSLRVEHLVAQIDALIANDTAGETPFLDDPHEIGQIAKGVEALRRSLIETRGAWGDVLLNEMRYLLIAENMREVILLTDPHGAILFASPSAAAFTGADNDLDGVPVWDLFDPEDAQDLWDSLHGSGRAMVARPACRPRQASQQTWDVTLRPSSEDEENLLFVLSPGPLAERRFVGRCDEQGSGRALAAG